MKMNSNNKNCTSGKEKILDDNDEEKKFHFNAC